MNRRGFLGGLLAAPLILRAPAFGRLIGGQPRTLIEWYGRSPMQDIIEDLNRHNEIMQDMLYEDARLFGLGVARMERGVITRLPPSRWRVS